MQTTQHKIHTHLSCKRHVYNKTTHAASIIHLLDKNASSTVKDKITALARSIKVMNIIDITVKLCVIHCACNFMHNYYLLLIKPRFKTRFQAFWHFRNTLHYSLVKSVKRIVNVIYRPIPFDCSAIGAYKAEYETSQGRYILQNVSGFDIVLKKHSARLMQKGFDKKDSSSTTCSNYVLKPI